MANNDRARRRYKHDPEKVIRMARDGLEKHRAKGNVVTMEKLAGSALGVQLNRKDRQHMQGLVTIAVAEMAQRQFDAWADCAEELHHWMINKGFKRKVALATLQNIENAAIEVSGDPLVGKAARTFLQARRNRVITTGSVKH